MEDLQAINDRLKEANTRLVEKNRALEAEIGTLMKEREALIVALTQSVYSEAQAILRDEV